MRTLETILRGSGFQQTGIPGTLSKVSPLLPGSVREDSQDLFVQQLRLLQPRQLLSQFHLQAVASTVFPFQMLDGADAPGGQRREREHQDPTAATTSRRPGGGGGPPQLA